MSWQTKAPGLESSFSLHFGSVKGGELCVFCHPSSRAIALPAAGQGGPGVRSHAASWDQACLVSNKGSIHHGGGDTQRDWGDELK